MTLLSAAVFLLASCGARSRHVGEDISDGDSDSDMDVDVDVDVDVDADADADEDAGVGYDAGPDPGRTCVEHAANAAPYYPQPLYPTIEDCVRVLQPTLKVANSSDLDGDALRYHFDIDRDVGFRSIDLQTTPDEGVPEGPPGFTEWRVPRALVDGETYYWRAWVDDCWDESEKIVSVFEVCAG